MIQPMLCGEKPPEYLNTATGVLLQRKYDGTRCLLIVNKGKVQMIGRSHKNDYASRYPQIVEEAKRLPDCILDCELTFFAPGGKDVFITALATPDTQRNYHVALMAFDILNYKGVSMQKERLVDRLRLLNQVMRYLDTKHILVVESYGTKFTEHYNSIIRSGGEGVVLKPFNSPYVEGEEGRKTWIKIKGVSTMDCYVCGCTHGNGKRSATMGALVLGCRLNNRWHFLGRASGMSDCELQLLYNKIMKMPHCTNYLDAPVKDAKRIVEPHIKVEVKFLGTTDSGMLRQPRFIKIKDGS